MSAHVPVLDLSAFSAAGGDKKAVVAEEMRKACVEVGFFYVKSPTLQPGVIDGGFQAMNELFDLPLAVKETANATNSKLYRGYQGTVSDSHSCTVGKARDLKESFTIGAVGDDSFMHGENQWPVDCSKSIQDRLNVYWDVLMRLAKEIAACLAISLGLEEDFFTKCMTNPVANMVLLRYPPPPMAEDGVTPLQTGCGAHTDCGFLTLLVQDKSADALQVKGKDGKWHEAPQIDETVLCNLGDMAEQWSNNFYKSTWHRVNNSSGKLRHSIPFFCNLDYDTIVDPKESVCKGMIQSLVGNPKFEAVKAGDYICQKLGIMHQGGSA